VGLSDRVQPDSDPTHFICSPGSDPSGADRADIDFIGSEGDVSGSMSRPEPPARARADPSRNSDPS